ncbi:hypothetical protein [uncultured Thiohalocapsa sp.]|uniref:hypothetical protein n=1 Tax=uncultured Thiohalocapsa sp. TaxID=768990 RepID=UPI0025F52824|nr:hypothetical protein [uncultured Thiohalocapsa sp.]
MADATNSAQVSDAAAASGRGGHGSGSDPVGVRATAHGDDVLWALRAMVAVLLHIRDC